MSLTVPARGKTCDGGLLGGVGGGRSAAAGAEDVKEEEVGEEAGLLLPAAAAAKEEGEGAEGDGAGAEKQEKGAKKEGDRALRCAHSGTVHYSWWNKHVANPIREHGYDAAGAAAMRLLRGTILEACMLRRTK